MCSSDLVVHLRVFAFSLLPYNENALGNKRKQKARIEKGLHGRGADELVTLQSGGNLEMSTILALASTYPVGA